MDSNNNDTPSNEELTGHEYDGIQEFDNPLPNWWLVTFFGTIIFGFIYFIHYEFGGAATQAQELQADMKALPKTNTEDWDEGDLQTRMAAIGKLDRGEQVFAGKCAACHAPDGGGLIGPNLTDRFWLHGKGTRTDLMRVISQGVPDKGMPAWNSMISPDEVFHVAAFVYSLKDKQPANPKPPQGEEVKP